jgi:4-amino-4-deoxy-L-arabinose transferase
VLFQTISNHRLIVFLLAAAAFLFFAFPLQLQSMEAYAYAAAIEKYYNIADTFALAQGEYLPDFGRYHPNHPIGHLLAGLMFDWLGIPALTWMRLTNVTSTLAAGLFLYSLALQLKFSKYAAVNSVALFLTTHVTLFAVYSGEWHMPSLAMALAGTAQLLSYVQQEAKRNLYFGALLFFLAVSYHTAALSLAVCLGVAMLLTLRECWRPIATAATIAGIGVILIYFVIPIYLFRFQSASDFAKVFLIYRYLDNTHHGIIAWILIAVQTLFHSFLFIPAALPAMSWFVFPFLAGFGVAAWHFFRSQLAGFVKLLFLFMLVGWPSAMAIAGSRPNGLNGWIFMAPILCLMVAKALDRFHHPRSLAVALLPATLLAWNMKHAILPNHFAKREDIFLFQVPETVLPQTPVAFVVNELVTSMSEIWNAGSILDFRTQTVFYPCCGEDAFALRLRRWLAEYPGGIVVSDYAPEQMERLLMSLGLSYVRWQDRTVVWPAALLPATLYYKRDPGYEYRKRLIVWIPLDRMPY